jgi:hypothetical protein
MEMELNSSFSTHYPKMRKAVIVLLLVAIFPILILYIYKDSRRASMVNKDTEYIAQRAAITIAGTIDNKFLETKSILAVIASGYTIKQNDHLICDNVMKSIVKNLQGYALIGAIDGKGNTYCNSGDYVYGQYSGDRSYFKRTVELGTFAGGEFQVSRIAGIPTLNFGYPVFDEKGNPDGITAAAFDLTYFQDLNIYKNLDPTAIVTLIDQKGTVLATYPKDDRVGKILNDNPIANKVITSNTEGGLFDVADEDGINYIVGFSRLNQTIATGNLFVYVVMPQSTLLSNANNDTYMDIVFLTVVLLLTGIVEYILWVKTIKPIVQACQADVTSLE